MKKKKVLLVTRNFPPLIGGMEKLNFNIFQVLAKKYELLIAGPHGSSKYHMQERFVEFSPSPVWKYVFSSLFKTVYLAKKEPPALVFCGSGAAILAGYFAAKFTGAKLVCYLHGLDIIANNFIYQKIFIPLIKKSHLILVNSQHTKGLAIKSGLDAKLIKILSPGTNLPDINNRILLERQFRQQYGLQNAPFLLIAGRLTKRKGILEFIENVMPELIAKQPLLKLVIVGEEAIQAITHQSGIKDKIIYSVSTLGLNDSVYVLGGVDDVALSAAYFCAEMLIFPVLNIPNDVEGFGMVAVEAAAHGLPTIGFAVGGVPDAIAEGKSGWLVLPGNYQEMGEIISNYTAHIATSEISSESCIAFAREFEWSRFGERLEKILVEEVI